MDFDSFQQALGDHNWPLLAAFLILTTVRLAKLPFVGDYWDRIPKQYRPLVPVVMGVLSGVGDALLLGRDWLPALIFGLVAGLTAIGADQAITKPLSGKESGTT